MSIEKIRATFVAGYGLDDGDVRALLAEIDRLTEEREAGRKLLAQVSAESLSLRVAAERERDAARAEVERLRKVAEVALEYELAKYRYDGWPTDRFEKPMNDALRRLRDALDALDKTRGERLDDALGRCLDAALSDALDETGGSQWDPLK